VYATAFENWCYQGRFQMRAIAAQWIILFLMIIGGLISCICCRKKKDTSV
jgi:hypothetical protein